MSQSGQSGSTERGAVDHTYVSKGAELVIGGTTYHADFSGKFSTHHDPEHLSHFHSGARSQMHHRIHGHTAQGHGSGIGTITIRQDPDHEPHPSTLTATVPGKAFPAVHEMAMNIHVTIPNLLPGITLRNKPLPNPGPAILRNPNVTNFPPAGDVYQLVQPIELEDIKNPGPVPATLQTFPVTVNPPPP